MASTMFTVFNPYVYKMLCYLQKDCVPAWLKKGFFPIEKMNVHTFEFTFFKVGCKIYSTEDDFCSLYLQCFDSRKPFDKYNFGFIRQYFSEDVIKQAYDIAEYGTDLGIYVYSFECGTQLIFDVYKGECLYSLIDTNKQRNTN